MRVVVFGASGMLGSMVTRRLADDEAVQVVATTRQDRVRDAVRTLFPGVRVAHFDAEHAADGDIVRVLDGAGWAINAIGIIKPLIRDDVAADVERAVRVNAMFPHALARAAERTGARVIQIATDCVYSGARGHYRESDAHDPIDVYGRTKSLGETASPVTTHLRCSIVGPELEGHISLLDWFLGQPRGAAIRGYTNHRWNGLTTWHFAKLCAAVVTGAAVVRPGLQHVVPDGEITKHDLLGEMARAFGRGDVTIAPTETAVGVDRTLATAHDDANTRLWAAAGYAAPPSIPTMLDELASQTP